MKVFIEVNIPDDIEDLYIEDVKVQMNGEDICKSFVVLAGEYVPLIEE